MIQVNAKEKGVRYKKIDDRYGTIMSAMERAVAIESDPVFPVQKEKARLPAAFRPAHTQRSYRLMAQKSGYAVAMRNLHEVEKGITTALTDMNAYTTVPFGSGPLRELFILLEEHTENFVYN